MSPEKQRIAIAKACGYVDPQLRPRRLTGNYEDDLCESLSETTEVWGREIPDYLNDLNAMHEAEITALPMYLMEYCSNLAEIVYEYPGAARVNQLWQGWWFVHATAAQRAEAFLKTLNFWTDD